MQEQANNNIVVIRYEQNAVFGKDAEVKTVFVTARYLSVQLFPY